MFEGVYVPVVTPFFEDGTLDLTSLSKLCERLVSQDVAGIVPLGTTGEASALNLSERHEVVATCAKEISGTGVELVIGAGTNSTVTTLERMDEFAEFNPEAYLIVTPYYVRPSEDGIMAHFLTCAEKANEIGSDVMLYNVPARTGRGISSEGLLTCGTHPRVTGVKQAVGSLDDDTLNLIANATDEFAILSGDDYLAAPMALIGAKGAVAASAHIATPLWVEMIDCALNGDAARALELHKLLLPVAKAGFAEPNPTVFKGALAAAGEISSDFVRLPLIPAKKESSQALAEIAKSL